MLSLTNLEIEAIELSIKVAFYSVLFTLPLGLLTAWILARKKFYGYTLFNGIVHLPLVLPPVVVGFFLLTLLGRNGPIGNILKNTFDITNLELVEDNFLQFSFGEDIYNVQVDDVSVKEIQEVFTSFNF